MNRRAAVGLARRNRGAGVVLGAAILDRGEGVNVRRGATVTERDGEP